jgi:hypothetical protein
MRYDPNQALRAYPHIRSMLQGIPHELWHIFLPDSVHDLAVFERIIQIFKSRETDRAKVMAIQKACGFPLRPNAPLSEMVAKLNIQKLKKKRFEPDDGAEDADSA